MFKRTRLLQSLFLCFSLSFVACEKGDKEKDDDDDKSTKDDDDDKETDDDSKKKDDDDDKSTSDDDKKDSGSTKEDDKGTGDGDALVSARELFTKECESCHGKNGEGKSSFKTEDMSSDKAKEWKDSYIVDSITDGIEVSSGVSMPSFKGDLDEKKIKSLLALIRCFQEKSDAADCGKS